MSIGGGEQTSTSSTELPPYIQEAQRANINIGNSLANRPYSPYPEQRIAEFTPDQMAGFDATRAMSTGPQLGMGHGVASGVAANVGNFDFMKNGFGHGVAYNVATGAPIGWNPIEAMRRGEVRDVSGGSLNGANLSGYMDPFRQSVIDTTMTDLGRQNAMAHEGINAGAARAGAFGGSRHGVMGAEQNRNFMDTAARTVAGLNSQNYGQAQAAAQADLSRGLQAQGMNQGVDLSVGQLGQQARTANSQGAMQAQIADAQTKLAAAAQMQASAGARNNAFLQQQQGMLGAADSMRTSALARQQRDQGNVQGLLGIGGMQQGMDQQNIDLAYQDFLRQFQYPMDMLGLRQNVASVPTGSTTTSTGPGQDSTGQVLGSGLMAAAMYFSDRHLKTDIAPAGTGPHGLGVYRFRYLWDDPGAPLRTGFMADEVERVMPAAVHVTESGFKAVDYDMVLGTGGAR